MTQLVGIIVAFYFMALLSLALSSASSSTTTVSNLPQVAAITSKESPSQKAAKLLPEGVIKTVEPGDGEFETSLMDPTFRYAKCESGQVKAYRPVLFQKLRGAAGVSENHYAHCLDIDNLSCLSSDSKSGQAFWVSNDGSIVVKTIKQYECHNLCRILDSYADHMLSGKSCISSILGIYRVKTKSGAQRYFLVNKNVYPAAIGSGHVLRRFDLKGSTVGRKAAASSPVQKDLDLITSGQSLPLGFHARSLVLKVLERDAAFLRSHGFMDYSLLVAVESTDAYRFSQRFGTFSVVEDTTDSVYRELYHPDEPSETVFRDDNDDNDTTNTTTTTEEEVVSMGDEQGEHGINNNKGSANHFNNKGEGNHHSMRTKERHAENNLNGRGGLTRGSRVVGEGVASLLDEDKGKLVVLGEDGLTYHLGVIDFLQKYTFRKLMETLLKGIIDDARKISAVAPTLYATRMLSFIAKFTR